MDKDEEIRFRVTSESFVDTSPSAPDAKGRLTKVLLIKTCNGIFFIKQNHSYQNMTIAKVALLFLYLPMKKKLRRIQSIFDTEK